MLLRIFEYVGYFQSKLCQVEIREAVAKNKPVVIVYEGEGYQVMNEMFDQCARYCLPYEDPNIIDSKTIEARQHVFKNDPILWLSNGSDVFTAASLKLIYESILSHLPHYTKYSGQLPGLEVPGGVRDPTPIKYNMKILYSGANYGARDIADKLQTMLSERNKNRDIQVEQLKVDVPRDGVPNSNSSDSDAFSFHSAISSEGAGDIAAEDLNDLLQDMNADDARESMTSLLRVSTIQQMDGRRGRNSSILGGKSDRFKEIFLLYLNWRLLQSQQKKKEVGAVVREMLRRKVNVVIVYDHNDHTPCSFYWQELVNQPYDDTIKAIPYFTNPADHHNPSSRPDQEYYCETSMKEILNKSITLFDEDEKESRRASIVSMLRSSIVSVSG